MRTQRLSVVRFSVLPLLVLALSLHTSPTLAASPGTERPAADVPIYSSSLEVSLVNVDVVVTDRDGKPVTGLRKGDFQLLVDGRSVDVANFAELGGSARAVAAPSKSSSPAAAPEVEAAPPLRIVVYFDNKNLRLASRRLAVQQVRKFLQHQLGADDEVMIATNDLRLRVAQPFTADRSALETQLDRLETAPTYGDSVDRDRNTALQAILSAQAMAKEKESRAASGSLEEPCSLQVPAPAEQFASTARAEVEQTARALTVMVDSLAGIPGRKALLYVSDGVPLTPGEELFEVLYQLCGGDPSSGLGVAVDAEALGADTYKGTRAILDAQKYNTATIWNKVTTHANSNRVSFYTLQPRDPVDAMAGAMVGEKGEAFLRLPRISTSVTANFQNTLSVMASETGGRLIVNGNDFSGALASMQEDFRHFYSLAYTPDAKGGRSQRRIEVRVKGSGMRVSYQRAVADRSAIERVADRTLSALFWDHSENPLEATIEVGDQTPAENGAYAVPLRLRIPLFKLAVLNQGDQFSADLRLIVASRDSTGTLDPLRQVAVPIRISNREVLRALGQYYIYNLTLQLLPGERRIAIAVRDDVAATVSYLTQNLQVGPDGAIGASSTSAAPSAHP